MVPRQLTCSNCAVSLTEASIPAGVQGRQHLAGRRLDRRLGHGRGRSRTTAPNPGADPEARWGHRNVGPRDRGRGRCSTAATSPAAVMVNDEDGPAVPELVRRITVCQQRPRPGRRHRPGPGSP